MLSVDCLLYVAISRFFKHCGLGPCITHEHGALHLYDYRIPTNSIDIGICIGYSHTITDRDSFSEISIITRNFYVIYHFYGDIDIGPRVPMSKIDLHPNTRLPVTADEIEPSMIYAFAEKIKFWPVEPYISRYL